MTMNDIEYRKELNKLTLYQPGKSIEAVKKEFNCERIIKCASNENPLGCPLPSDVLMDLLKSIHYYPDSVNHDITTALQNKHRLPASHFVLGNGSDDVFLLCAQALLTDNDTVISSAHTFSVYSYVTQLMGATYHAVPMKEFGYDLDGILQAVTKDSKLIFIANPNNPTGTFLSHKQLSDFLEKLPSHVVCVLDEAYRDYVSLEDIHLNEQLLRIYPNLIITRTFSKIYGMAGFRLGYGMAQEALCTLLQKVRAPFNVNSLALTAGHYALTQGDSFVERSRQVNEIGLRFFMQQAKKWPVSYLESQANFICLFMTDHTANDAYDFCIQRGIIIRPLTHFGFDKGIRITICNNEENHIIAKTLTEFFT